MPTISGSLNLVTDRPVDSISEVWVRARETRGQGDGLVVGVNDRVSVSDGAVEFTAVSGAAVLVLVQNGMPIETLPMLVSDEAQQSLRAVVQAAEVAGSADKREIEQLAAEFATSITLAAQYRTEAAASASAAQASESAAATSESNAKTSENRAKQSETNAGDFAAVATTAATEAVDAMDAAALSAAAFSIYTGTGSPEGKIAAPVGSIYTDSAATNGAIRWVKIRGTSVTGWRVEYGDTGWRDISGLLNDGWGGNVYMIRVNDSVEFRVEELTRSTNSNDILTFPEGFLPRPVARLGFRFNLHQADSTASQTRFRIVNGKFSTFNWPNTSAPYYGGASWLGSETWPTTLPGIPA